MMKNVLFAVLSAAGILAAGCSKDSETQEVSIPGSLRITIVNEAGNSSRAIGTPTDEGIVHNFAVFVFDQITRDLERAQVFTGTEGVITGLNTSTNKQVVVMANHTFDFFDDIDVYTDLENLTLDLQTQTPGDFSESGLFMSGLYGSLVTLDPDGENAITVPISRVVSKVQLESLNVNPGSEYDLTLFSLNGVSVQKVPSLTYMYGNNIYPINPALTDEFYYGGLTGSVSTPWDALVEPYSLSEDYEAGSMLTPEIYFYVFPNDDSQGMATMLSISATYDGTPLYYNFIINDAIAESGEGTTDGTYITRNKIYTLNIILQRLGVGASDADSTDQFADLTVNVTVNDWEGPLVQNITW